MEQEAGKFIVDSSESLIEPSAPLPETYGDNCLVLLVRDPFWFFAYWEITPQRLNEFHQKYGPELWDRGQAVLRVYEVAGLNEEAFAPRRYFDVGVQMEARRWYVQADQSGRTYLAELGIKLPDGRFIPLLRSNRITLPRGRVSDQTDSQWIAVNPAEWDKLMDVAGGAEHIGRGSVEISRVMAQRWEFLKSVFSGSFPPGSVSSKKP